MELKVVSVHLKLQQLKFNQYMQRPEDHFQAVFTLHRLQAPAYFLLSSSGA